MTERLDPEILVITTHYPFGKIEENWIAAELDELCRQFSAVYILPVKELPGLRQIPHNANLLRPLASRNRLAFFLSHAIMLTTLMHFASALGELARGPGINLRRAVLSLKFACYYSAFQRNRQINSFLATRKSHIVYAYWGHIPALVVPLARQSGARTCVRYHAGDLYVERPEVGGFFPFRSKVRECTDLNAFISEHGRAYFLKKVGEVAKERSAVYRLGSRDYGPALPRAKFGTKSVISMASASWIYPIKRVELIAELAGELAHHCPVVWHHFGDGDMSAISLAVAKARSRGAIIYFHGQVATEKLQQFYRENSLTFFVNLSRDEGIPVSVMEAMNADIPVVATNVGGTSEVVINGRSGILVDSDIPGGIAGLAEQIVTALGDGGELDSAEPREVWQELCDGKLLARQFAQDLLHLVREGAA